ncbi:MAG: ATP-binding protein [Candidatus Nanopelagicales bacterium]
MALHEILQNTVRAPREARRAIDRFLTKAHLSQITDDAQLLASELVTNAVKHANGPIDVRAYVRDGYLRLEVGDCAADVTPLRRHAAATDEGGRGMELVEKLSARWGWRLRGPVKVVWLDLPMPAGADRPCADAADSPSAAGEPAGEPAGPTAGESAAPLSARGGRTSSARTA